MRFLLGIRDWSGERATQKHWNLGFHYNMRLEDAARGIELLSRPDEMPDLTSQRRTYPDVSRININID